MASTHDIEVHGIQYDSRKVQKGDLFVAIKGALTDGHRFIDTTYIYTKVDVGQLRTLAGQWPEVRP